MTKAPTDKEKADAAKADEQAATGETPPYYDSYDWDDESSGWLFGSK
jgi:hypothetical protein